MIDRPRVLTKLGIPLTTEATALLGAVILATVAVVMPVGAAELNLKSKLKGAELGMKVVVTDGQTDWNHFSPGLGDPTSKLTYDDTRMFALEINGKMPLPKKHFIRANVGLGIEEIGDGNLRDDDWNAAQVLTSSTDSVIPDTDLFYLTVDVGREVVKFGDKKGSLSLFVGFQYWREKHEGFGVFDRIGGAGQTVPTSTLVISNEVEWKSFRVGAIGTYKINDKVSLSGDVAAIPYAFMSNKDSHHLRTSLADLGPVPNIILDDEGWGFQGEIGVAYRITPNWRASLDFRYWTLMSSDGDIVFGPNSTTPSATLRLNDLDTYRYGVSLGTVYRF